MPFIFPLVSMVGEAGFEPAHHGVKVRCLTTWLLPITLLIHNMYNLKESIHRNGALFKHSLLCIPEILTIL